MKKAVRGRSIDTIFVLIVFGIFAFSVLMVLMLGASIYRNINDISQDGHYEHTALSYIWTKTKNFDEAGSVHVGDFNGVPALFIDELLGDTEFRTAVYHYDGWLMELFSEAELEFSPMDGVRIVMVDDLSFAEVNYGPVDDSSSLIKVDAGGMVLLLSPRSGFAKSYDKTVGDQ